MSEDCLTLNVYTPLGTNNKRLQTKHSHRYFVLVWIHGGYYQAFTAGSPFYNGLTLGSAAQIIVATLNYRLGIVYFPVKPFKSDNHFQISNLHVHVYHKILKWEWYEALTLTIYNTFFKLEQKYIFYIHCSLSYATSYVLSFSYLRCPRVSENPRSRNNWELRFLRPMTCIAVGSRQYPLLWR